MNTFVIAGKRYRIKSKARFMTFITLVLVAVVIISGTAFGGGVSGGENPVYKEITVESGDTLWSIARENKPEDVSIRQYVSEMKALNDVGAAIYPGQVIKTPAR